MYIFSMGEKLQMTAFFGANLADSIITKIAIDSRLGFEEIGLMGSQYADINHPIIIKMSVISLLVGSYALSKSAENEKLAYVHETVFKYTTPLVALVVLSNTLQYLSAT